jgi:uncharacterized membrane protein YvbJ
MALIECSDCGAQVSSNAAACVKCGSPITTAYEKRATGVDLVTTQATAKRLKLYLVIAGVMFWFGLFSYIVSVVNESGDSFSGWFVFLGLMLYGVTKLRIWWHHH